MRDDTPNEFYESHNSKSKHFQGIGEFLNSETSDVFYRKCEYRTAAFNAGLNIELWNLSKGLFGRNEPVERPFDIVILARRPKTNECCEGPTAW